MPSQSGQTDVRALELEVTKLRQKLEYLHAEKTSAIATKDFERAKSTVPQISQAERDLVDVQGRIAKTRKRASHTRNDRDQRIIEGKAALKALIEKKHYLLKAENYRELARLQEEMDLVTQQLEADGATTDVRVDVPGQGAPPESTSNELRQYNQARSKEESTLGWSCWLF